MPQYTKMFTGEIYQINPRTEYVEPVCPVTLPVGTANQIATANGFMNPLDAYNFKVNYNWMNESMPFPDKPEGCAHTWKTYNGFTETYKFCEKCDKKEFNL